MATDQRSILVLVCRARGSARRLHSRVEQLVALTRQTWPALAVDLWEEQRGQSALRTYLRASRVPPGPAAAGEDVTSANLLATLRALLPEIVTEESLNADFGPAWRREVNVYLVLDNLIIEKLLAQAATGKIPAEPLLDLLERALDSPDDLLASAAALELGERLTPVEIELCRTKGGPRLRKLLPENTTG
jgi:hypothetical protein